MTEGSGFNLIVYHIAVSQLPYHNCLILMIFFKAPNQVNVNRDMFEMVPASNDRVR